MGILCSANSYGNNISSRFDTVHCTSRRKLPEQPARLHAAMSRAVINYLRTIYCRSDISPGNSLSIPQYTAILMFVSSVFCRLLEVNDDDDDDDVLMMIYSGSTDSEAWDQLPLSQVAEIAKTVPKWH